MRYAPAMPRIPVWLISTANFILEGASAAFFTKRGQTQNVATQNTKSSKTQRQLPPGRH